MRHRWFTLGLMAIGTFALLAKTTPLRAEEKGEEDEVKVKIADVPKAVRKTLKRESFGADIKTVDKEKRDGKTVYEADVKIDDQNYEVVVGEDGKLVSKKVDNEDEEKGEAKASEKKDSAKAAKSKKGEEDEDDDEKPAKKKPASKDKEDDEK